MNSIQKIFVYFLQIFLLVNISHGDDGTVEKCIQVLKNQKLDVHDPKLYKEVLVLIHKSQHISEFIIGLEQRKKELLSINVLPELLWHAAKDCKFDYQQIKKIYPNLLKESGGVGILDGKNPKLIVDVNPPDIPIKMIFEKNGELQFVEVQGPDIAPEKYELKTINGKQYLLTYFTDRPGIDSTERLEFVDYFLIEDEKILHEKTEKRFHPLNQKHSLSND